MADLLMRATEPATDHPVFPVQLLIPADSVWPVPYQVNRKTLVPGPWMPGDEKPVREGRYLRYFDDCNDCAFSEWRGGTWTRDGFWPSDVQDAPWRGGVKP